MKNINFAHHAIIYQNQTKKNNVGKTKCPHDSMVFRSTFSNKSLKFVTSSHMVMEEFWLTPLYNIPPVH